MRENVTKQTSRSLCALTLYFTSWTQQLNWVQPKALLKCHIHISSCSTLKTAFFFHPLPMQAFLPLRYLPANSLHRCVSCSYSSVCPLQFPRHWHCGPYREPKALLPSPVRSWPQGSASRQRVQDVCDHLVLKRSQGKDPQFNWAFISLLQSVWIAHHWTVLGNSVPCKFYSLKIFPS